MYGTEFEEKLAISSDTEAQKMLATGQPVSGLWDMIRIQLQLQQTKLNATDVCTDRINIIVVYEFALIPAVIMLIMACCSMRRKRFLPDFLNGRPGLAHPMNILEDRSFRFSYALAFGIAAQLCHDLLFGDSELYKRYITSRPEGQFKFLHVLYRISEICLYCVIMYPIFITITKRNILFFGMGTLYMWGLTLMSILRLAWLDCAALTLESHIIIMIKFLPSIGCMVSLSVIFPYRMVQLILDHNASMRVTRQEYVYQVEYVRDLFIGEKDSEDSGPSNSAREKLKKALKAISYQRQIGFRYSPRIICTYTAVGIVVYMVLYSIIKEVFYWIKLLTDILDLLERIIGTIGIGADTALRELNQARVYIRVFTICFIISISVVLILSICNVVLMILNYRTNIFKMYRGNYTGFPTRKERTTQPTYLILSNIRYGGYQISFTGIGIVAQLVLLMTILLFVSMVLFDPVDVGLREWFLEFIEYYWPLTVISGTVLLVQYLLVKFVFNSSSSSNGNIAVKNRHLYFNWAYFMFYFNVFWGLLTATLRLLKSLAFTVCFFSRLDWCHFPKRFEMLDEGYFAYVGLLYVENAHTNPVLRTFIGVVQDAVHGRERFSTNPFAKQRSTDNVASEPAGLQLRSVAVLEDAKHSYARSASQAELLSMESIISERLQRRNFTARKRSRTRWFLALTLANNPGLRQQRSHYMVQLNATRKRKSVHTLLVEPNVEQVQAVSV